MKNSPPPVIHRFALVSCAMRSRLWRRPCCLLVAQASPSRLTLCACSSGFALAAHATRSRLGLRPRCKRYALAACLRLALRASPSRFTLCACLSGLALAARALPLRLADRATRSLLGFCPRSSCCDEDTGGNSDCWGTNNQQSTKRTETATMTVTTITIETKGMAVAVAAEAR